MPTKSAVTPAPSTTALPVRKLFLISLGGTTYELRISLKLVPVSRRISPRDLRALRVPDRLMESCSNRYLDG
jgi:hypothetical protein